MKPGRMMRVLVLLFPVPFLGCSVRTENGNHPPEVGASADGDRKESNPSVVGADTAADSATSAQKAARDAMAKFEKEWKHSDRKKTWKVRMECLVALMKAGPAAVPVLVDVLKTGSPQSRAFAAQALGFLADPGARPALVEAVDDKEQVVRHQAIKALGRLGRQEATPAFRHIAEKDPSVDLQFVMTFALTRDDKPEPVPIRQALIDYDLTRMDRAHVGEAAPDFALADTAGKIWRLSQFRGKKSVVLVFLMGFC